MGFNLSYVTGTPETGQFLSGSWFVLESCKHSDGSVEIGLRDVSGENGLLGVTLRCSPTFDVRKFVTDCLDNYPLGDPSRDDHLSWTVVGGVTPVSGPSLSGVPHAEPTPTRSAPEDFEPGEEAV